MTALFYDGGIFDNQPLRLAVQLASRGFFREGGVGKWRPVPSVTLSGVPRDGVFLYMDPDTDVLPELASHDHPPLDSAVSYLLYLAGQLVGSVRTKELQSLLEDSPGVKRQIGTTLTYFRPLSASLRNFFGLFERDVRVHDYYLGMHDAARFVSDVVVPWSGSKGLVLPETAVAKTDPATVSSWQAFMCMRAVFDHIGDVKSCDNVPQNLRIAMQVTLDTLYARCAQVFDESIKEGQSAPGTLHEHCRRAMAGKSPPHVPGVIDEPNWKYESTEEDAFDHQLRRLSVYNFAYNDLGLDAREAKYARRKIARALNEATDQLASQQKSGVLVSTLGRTWPLQYLALRAAELRAHVHVRQHASRSRPATRAVKTQAPGRGSTLRSASRGSRRRWALLRIRCSSSRPSWASSSSRCSSRATRFSGGWARAPGFSSRPTTRSRRRRATRGCRARGRSSSPSLP